MDLMGDVTLISVQPVMDLTEEIDLVKMDTVVTDSVKTDSVENTLKTNLSEKESVMDLTLDDEITFRVNVIVPAANFPQGASADAAKGAEKAMRAGVQDKFATKRDPPTFSGKVEDFDSWEERFRYFLGYRSPGILDMIENLSPVWRSTLCRILPMHWRKIQRLHQKQLKQALKQP
jgi:hypothetical protein